MSRRHDSQFTKNGCSVSWVVVENTSFDGYMDGRFLSITSTDHCSIYSKYYKEDQEESGASHRKQLDDRCHTLCRSLGTDRIVSLGLTLISEV